MTRQRWITAGVVASLVAVIAGCATFPESAAPFTVQPSLTPNVATLIPPSPPGVDSGPSSSPSSTDQSTPPQPSSTPTPESPQSTDPEAPSGAEAEPDPCAIPELPVVAVCLESPWGLAVLPGGASALVGERTTGKIFSITPGRALELVATIDGVDASGGGGLLGIALSPYFVEDNLIYAYVTTAEDNRIVRIAPGDSPKAIFTGIPRGAVHNGGPIAFGADGLLYVLTGDAGDATAAPDAESLAGKVLRLDAFGAPAGSRSGSGTGGQSGTGSAAASAVHAVGMTDPTGICPLPDGRLAAVDHRGSDDVLVPVSQSRQNASRTESPGETPSTTGAAPPTTPSTPSAPPAAPPSTRPLDLPDEPWDVAAVSPIWTYQPGDGGATDCAMTSNALMATARSANKVTSIPVTESGGFTGSPADLLADQYGQLRTVTAGPNDLAWLTTSNKSAYADGAGPVPDPSDDRVIILPPESAGGEGGGID